MEEEKIIELNRMFQEPDKQITAAFSKKKSGIALRNVNARIKMLFGMEYGLYILGSMYAGTESADYAAESGRADGTDVYQESGKGTERRDKVKKEVLRIERGTKRMGKSAGIQDFSIQIYRGEICGLLVENNLERKMLIRILSGEERLDYGWYMSLKHGQNGKNIPRFWKTQYG